MYKTGLREFFIADDKKIDYLKERMKSAISEIDVPPEYYIKVYSDLYNYITFEVSGPDKERIKSIDLRAMSKLIEICEKENLDAHCCGPFAIVPTNTDEVSTTNQLKILRYQLRI